MSAPLKAIDGNADLPALMNDLAKRARAAARVLALFAHRGATSVVRYDLPKLQAFNFVIDDVLEGGVNGSLNLDGHGKSQSFRLLEMEIEVPAELLRPQSEGKT